jgi:wobble nucleotide-excising tRNase
MLKKIETIKKFGVFDDFKWNDEVRGNGGSVQCFKDINIIYGRNYSGKTTLSRIIRSLETGQVPEGYEAGSFDLKFTDGSNISQNDLVGHGKTVRVFNEDFVRKNLRFIVNPDESIEPFAVLGQDNNQIEQEIKRLENELGSNEAGHETGLFSNYVEAKRKLSDIKDEYDEDVRKLEKQLQDKATTRKKGIKYQSERFGDQNYTITKLRKDIERVQSPSYREMTPDRKEECEKLIKENVLPKIPVFNLPKLSFEQFLSKAETLVTKKVGESDKIESLVRNAVLNRWVKEGRELHKGKYEKCAFCNSAITPERWVELEKHFDQESDNLEKAIDSLIDSINAEHDSINVPKIEKSQFYSKFHARVTQLSDEISYAVQRYKASLISLVSQLEDRKKDILNVHKFTRPEDYSTTLQNLWEQYKEVCKESDQFGNSLESEKRKAKEDLRLQEVYDYSETIDYRGQCESIENLRKNLDEKKEEVRRISEKIESKKSLIAEKRRSMKDEAEGAKRVNEYLINFFGHQFLKLEPMVDEADEEESGKVRFEVLRDGEKAYHMSEGERSLLAFCYFVAKLDDIETRDSKPIIWIDDPISSLDSSHIFFVYSMLRGEIVSKCKFAQLFVSTHNLDFLKYLTKLDCRKKRLNKEFFLISRHSSFSKIQIMPSYLKNYVTEFNYLFHQIYKCSTIDVIDDNNYTAFYNFGNNARKFLEIYLYYKYPDKGMKEETLTLFFGNEEIPAFLVDRINNEYSHLSGVFERGGSPIEVPEMKKAAQLIIEKLKQDPDQFKALLKSVGEPVPETI